MKTCTKCGESKSLSEFGVRSSAKDGLSFQCKPCVRARNKAYYLSDPAKSAAQRVEYYSRNREQLVEQRTDYARRNPGLKKAQMAKYRETNLERYRERARSWARNNRDKINAYIARRLETDLVFRHKEALRGTLRACFLRVGTKKEGRTLDILGYSATDLALRMEAQFKAGMSWDNYGEWHIDHKIPVTHFIKKGELRPEVINALCNLQPLWAADNYRKGISLPTKLKDSNEKHNHIHRSSLGHCPASAHHQRVVRGPEDDAVLAVHVHSQHI